MRILSILVRYNTTKYPDALQQLINWQKNLEARCDTIVVDNSITSECTQEIQKDVVLIRGDNSFWEFSAWDKGISYVANRLYNYDLVNFVSESFYQSLKIFRCLELMSSPILEKIINENIALGHIDAFPEPVTICNYVSRIWLCTAHFLLSPSTVDKLKSINSLSGNEHIFSGNINYPFCSDAIIDSAYQEYLVGWLTGSNKKPWPLFNYHSKKSLNQKSLKLFQQKTTAIINEHLLTIRLLKLRCTIVDALWLFHHINEMNGPLISMIPSLEGQLSFLKQNCKTRKNI